VFDKTRNFGGCYALVEWVCGCWVEWEEGKMKAEGERDLYTFEVPTRALAPRQISGRTFSGGEKI
jgi:hypothetical protein